MTDQQLEKWLMREYGTTPGNEELIATAMLFWRRGREATARVDEEGLTVQPKKGLFRHPLIAVERECRLGFLRALKTLDELVMRRKSGGPTKVEQLPREAALSARGKRYLDQQSA